MSWKIDSFPACSYHVFLSHCAVDREWLVNPVYSQLRKRSIVTWLDQEDYYYGRDSRTALRDGLLRSRHVVFFVTQAMMAYARGWCQMELAYSNLIQANFLHPGASLLNFELPLFFLDRTDAGLPGTVWDAMRDKGRFHLPGDGDATAWAVEQIAAFLGREQAQALEMAKEFAIGTSGHAELAATIGRLNRITQFEPGPLPPAETSDAFA